MRQPRILLVSMTVPLPARRRTWQQARALAAAGWDVDALCPRLPGLAKRETIEGIAVTRFPQPLEGRGKLGIIVEYLVAAPILIAFLLWYRLRRRPDVVQVAAPPDWAVLPALLLRPLGARIAFDMADLSTLLFEAKFGRHRAFSPVVACLNRIAVKTADVVITANEVNRRLLRLQGRKGATIGVPSFPDILPSLTERVPGPLRIGYFGVLGDQDGVDRLIEAVALLQPEQLPPFELVIVGDGPAMPDLRELAANSGAADRIAFLGFLSGDRSEAALASFDIAVVPDPVNRFTATSSMNKSFVYAAHGLAVLGTPLAETLRMLPEALFAKNDSPRALAEGLRTLLGNDVLRKSIGKSLRQRAETRFDWPAAAARYVAAMAAQRG